MSAYKRKSVIISDNSHGDININLNEWLKTADEKEYDILSLTPMYHNGKRQIIIIYRYNSKKEESLQM